MNIESLLSSIISSSSIIIAIGFPLIIFLVSDYNNKKAKLLSQIKDVYPRLHAYKELVYYYSQIDFWNNNAVLSSYKKAIRKDNKNEIYKLLINNDFLSLFASMDFIANQYSKGTMHGIKNIHTKNEIEEYRIHINKIWYSINCRSDIKQTINIQSFTSLPDYELNKIRATINKIDAKVTTKPVSINLLARISGDIEMNVINKLCNLTRNYERPMHFFVKRLFWILSLSLIFGVVLPLLLLLISSIYTFYMAVAIVAIINLCLIALLILTGNYIGTF